MALGISKQVASLNIVSTTSVSGLWDLRFLREEPETGSGLGSSLSGRSLKEQQEFCLSLRKEVWLYSSLLAQTFALEASRLFQLVAATWSSVSEV